MESPKPSSPRELLIRRAPRVLVADDDVDMRMQIAEALADDGCIVIEARDGNELLDLIANQSDSGSPAFDAIVTDIMMPGFTGLDVLTAFRSRTTFVPVLVVTAYADADTERLARSLGAAEVLRKPFDLDKLRKVLVDALRAAPRAGRRSTPPRDT